MAAQDPCYRICRDDPEHVLDRAAGFNGSPPEDIPGPDIPPLGKVGPEWLDIPAGRGLAGKRLDHEIVIKAEDVPARVPGQGKRRNRAGTARVIRAVAEILFPGPGCGHKFAAGFHPAGPAVSAGRFPYHGPSLSPVEIVGTVQGL